VQVALAETPTALPFTGWKLQSFSSLESHLNGGVEPSVGISDGEDVGRI